ncbi:MAG: exosortase/archaeosortase family protein [Myxococcota bacterium]
MGASESGEAPGEGLGGAAFWKSPLVWAGLLAAALAAYIYYPLFLPPDHTTLTSQSEEFFFEANEAAGAPVLILSAWLFYRRSHYLDLLRGRGSLATGGFLFAITLALYAWGTYTSADDLRLASSISMGAAALFLLGGREAFRAYWVPVVFLAFALPLSPVLLSAAMYPIQLATSAYAGIVLNGMGVQSFVQGDQILRPENTFIVIETCSGVRTIVTLTMLTVLLIDLFERRGTHALLLMIMAPLVAFFTNGLRVVTLVLNPHSSIHSIHNLQGIGMLLVGLTLIYLLDGLLERLLGSRDPDAEEGDYGIASGESASSRGRALRFLVIAGVLALMLITDLVLPRWEYQRGLAETPDEMIARVFGAKSSAKVPPDYQFMGSVRYLSWTRRRVEVDGAPVDLFLGVGDEQQRAHSMLTKRLAWPDTGYAVVDESWVKLAPEGPEVRRMVLRKGARSVLSYSWFPRREGLVREWIRHAAALDRSFLTRPEHMLALRFATPLGPGGTRVEAAEARLRAVWSRLGPELEGYAPTEMAENIE